MFKLYPRVHLAIFLCMVFSLPFTQSFAKENLKYKKIKKFIPEGYEIFDTASGDLNGDGHRDYVLVLKSNDESINPAAVRPLLLLTGTPKGDLELLARNDQVVLCASCGGVFGDPYQKIAIKDQLLSVEHDIGAAWRWSRVITFKYDAETKQVLLHEDTTNSYQAAVPGKQTSVTSNKNDFGILSFSCYSYNKGF